MSEFNKDDVGKPMLSLIEPKFIEGLGKVLTAGGKHYGYSNWKTVPHDEVHRYKDALLRHLYAYLDGEKIDQDSGYSHLHHIGCNIMFLDYFDRNIV